MTSPLAALLVWLLFFLPLPAAPDCIAVEGGRLSARELARADAAFAALPPGTELGYSPAPGARRILRAAELAGWPRVPG